MLRSGARVGDVVAVSGHLGHAAAGLRMLFEHGVMDATELRSREPLVEAQLTPRPPIGDGVLASIAGATAMLDLSDGLALDARRIAAASGVAIDFDSGAIGSREALDGGEDHSLLATFPAGALLPGGFRVIGAVVEGSGVLVDGAAYEARGGWDPYEGWDGAAG